MVEAATGAGAVDAARKRSIENEKTADIGMIVFLGSWAMMFAGLFFAYASLRAQSPVWPPSGEQPLPLTLPSVSTGVLLLSSVLLQRALGMLKRSRTDKFLRGLIDAIALGVLFMALQWVLWTSLWDQGVHTGSGLLGSVFYMLTVVHCLHVVVGVGILAALLPKAWRRDYTSQNYGGVRRAAMFWHFVDVVWVLIFVSMFVL